LVSRSFIHPEALRRHYLSGCCFQQLHVKLNNHLRLAIGIVKLEPCQVAAQYQVAHRIAGLGHDGFQPATLPQSLDPVITNKQWQALAPASAPVRLDRLSPGIDQNTVAAQRRLGMGRQHAQGQCNGVLVCWRYIGSTQHVGCFCRALRQQGTSTDHCQRAQH